MEKTKPASFNPFYREQKYDHEISDFINPLPLPSRTVFLAHLCAGRATETAIQQAPEIVEIYTADDAAR